jgi:hypothetical protein
MIVVIFLDLRSAQDSPQPKDESAIGQQQVKSYKAFCNRNLC